MTTDDLPGGTGDPEKTETPAPTGGPPPDATADPPVRRWSIVNWLRRRGSPRHRRGTQIGSPGNARR